jgi:membrane protease YdiL (CAAX protease family)
MWLGPAAVALLVIGTILGFSLKPQSAGGQVQALTAILALIVSVAAVGLRTVIRRPAARRLIDLVTLERDTVATSTTARKAWGFWPSLFWVGLGAVVLVATRTLWPGWSAWMEAGNAWAWRAPANMLAWRLVQGVHEAAVVLLPLVIAVRLAGWPQKDYFALVRPRARWVAIGIACTLAWILAENAITFGLSFLVTGKSPWQPNGTPILMMWCAWSFAVLYAPVLEELTYRGFLYRGLVASRLGADGAVVVTAFVFALSHAYQGRSGLGLLLVFGTGVLLGWLRKRSGSTLLPILLHAIGNLADGLRQTLVNLAG